MLEVQGIPPGLFDPAVTYDTSTITVEPGDSVLFFTRRNIRRVQLERRIIWAGAIADGVRSVSGTAPTEFLAHLFSEVDLFAQGRSRT